jgi:hypothetical protein
MALRETFVSIIDQKPAQKNFVSFDFHFHPNGKSIASFIASPKLFHFFRCFLTKIQSTARRIEAFSLVERFD